MDPAGDVVAVPNIELMFETKCEVAWLMPPPLFSELPNVLPKLALEVPNKVVFDVPAGVLVAIAVGVVMMTAAVVAVVVVAMIVAVVEAGVATVVVVISPKENPVLLGATEVPAPNEKVEIAGALNGPAVVFTFVSNATVVADVLATRLKPVAP